LFLFNDEIWEKTEGVYCIWECSGQKPPSVSPNSPPSGRNSSRKIRTVTKSENLEKEPRIWLLFSLLVAPVKKMREVFVLHPVTEKKLSRFFKIRIILPGKCFEI
jgi:hypothetical protein